ncbi:MAG: ferrous iron transport protein A [Firmicutes bacterium]|nr:ferrous iron transport protein A [Bacillota bacterium]
MYLNSIKNSEQYIVNKINASEKIKRRLYDIGLINGTKIKLLFKSPSNKIKAYLIRDSIIAIRDNDASKIEVSELND